ncbi:MAG: mechanosensitive ion channel [Flavobacterium sp.]|uniref:Mechanosensitive ion channel n=1 Tax=Flavobacterium algoritolerans TaxID=3041254 RepID=A0ABT6VC82_9FLAO|nr:MULTISPECIES: mechanosensitive ion channel domain-containing protein [Flavobacterium]MDI5895843.1 mechanosensitive ion channel [Flavobacterium algoritolerans]MDP3681414.1 mechanosensitive ion channel [Flavobacterium sp.]MDZ4330230.1 mechanosensitive ion channel [Flavobacterium sp.]PIF62997.1 miniconductance mechanosensitive channel [Flavobacterium sp. 11]RKS14115.1 miniconductance mechanosensitive channel [Flavobacterium sp. 120]
MYKLIEKIFNFLYPIFRKWGLGSSFASYLSLFINIAILCVLAYAIYVVFRLILVTIMAVIAQKTKTKFDDLLVSNKTAKYIAHLIPLLFIYKSVPIILERYEYWEGVFGKLVGIYIVLLVLWIIRTIFNALRDYLKLKPRYSDKPIDSFIQVIMIVLWAVGITVIISKLFDIDQKELLTILGAVSAVIILIFRDTILGFVSSVQVSINDMVRIGDWITMDKFGADGDVIEINLATVKVRNFDNTTTTIPTYSLSSDSFQNWRGMLNSDGRRIKRHILIKTSSIRFLEEAELSDLKKIHLISDYIDTRKLEIDEYNSSHKIDKSIAINGRNLTNLGLFRKYITEYLFNYPGLNKDMLMLCRQLQSTSHGVPLEVYAFSHDKRFENYEYIMSDIFDHIIASVKYFDLEIFETVSENDFKV